MSESINDTIASFQWYVVNSLQQERRLYQKNWKRCLWAPSKTGLALYPSFLIPRQSLQNESRITRRRCFLNLILHVTKKRKQEASNIISSVNQPVVNSNLGNEEDYHNGYISLPENWNRRCCMSPQINQVTVIEGPVWVINVQIPRATKCVRTRTCVHFRSF